MAKKNKKNKKAKKITATKQVEAPQTAKGKKIPPGSIEQAQINRRQQLTKFKLEKAVKKVEEMVEENLPDAVRALKEVGFGDEVLNQNKSRILYKEFDKDKLQTAVDAVTKTWQAEEAAVAEATVITEPVTETDSATDKPSSSTKTLWEQIQEIEAEKKKRQATNSVTEEVATEEINKPDDYREATDEDRRVYAEASAAVAAAEVEAISFWMAILNQSLFKLWLQEHWKVIAIFAAMGISLLVIISTLSGAVSGKLTYFQEWSNSLMGSHYQPESVWTPWNLAIFCIATLVFLCLGFAILARKKDVEFIGEIENG